MFKIFKQIALKIMLICFILSCFFNKTYGAGVVQTEKLDDANGWTVNLTLPKYEESGEKINYSVQEQNVPDSYSQSVDGYTITNNLKEAKIIIKYIDKMTNKEIKNSKEEEGYIGKEYTANSEEIAGYKLVGNSGNISGKMNSNETTVSFYYQKLGSLTINKVDKDNNKITSGAARFEIYDEKNNKLHFKKSGENYIFSEDQKDLEYVETKNGQVLIENIVAGNYKILETKAPDGYFLSNSKKDFKITSDNFDIKVNIVNKKAFYLPITGSKSIFIISTISFSLINLGAFLFICKKISERKKR